MPEEFLKVHYDPQKKIWKSVNYPYGELVKNSLGDQFLKTIRSIDPNKIIDYFYDTNSSKTAKEVYEQSILIALNLQRMGVKKGDVVSLFCMNNEWALVLTFGIILIGALPNYFEVHLDEEAAATLFQTIQPTVILYEDVYLPKIQEALGQCKLQKPYHLISINSPQQPNIKGALLKTPQNPIDYNSFQAVKIQDTQHEIACLLLTSGSTGKPKVVQISHALMMHGTAVWFDNDTRYAPLDSDSVVFSFSPLRWVSQVAVILQAGLFGIKRVSSCGEPTGKYGLAVLRHCNITHIFGVPSIFYEILLQLKEGDTESLKSLKLIQLGGEPTSDIILELTRKHAINARSFNCYGMTEMSTCITNDEHINGGKPLPGYEVQILDENLKPLGVNQKGQISIRPPYPLIGYMAQDNTKNLSENGLFINGDYGLVDEKHRLHILCRYKDLIRSHGHILIPNTLEAIIINFPEVYVARLAGYRKTPDDPNEVAAFFVVLNPNVSEKQHSEITAKIYSTLGGHLSPDQLAVIKDVYYVGSVPLTSCGKIDRVELKKLALIKSQQ